MNKPQLTHNNLRLYSDGEVHNNFGVLLGGFTDDTDNPLFISNEELLTIPTEKFTTK